MNNKIWIVFEGIDGSGKTTQAKMLNDYLTKSGVNSLYKHIFDTEIGKMLRKIFIENDNLNNTTEILLLCATRQTYLDELLKSKENYDVIITDRFFWSIFAMQGQNDEDIALINYIKKIILKGKKQFVTYYLNTSPDECKKRFQKKIFNDRIEMKSIRFHQKVYKNYSKLLDIGNDVYIFNGKDKIDNIHRNIVDITRKMLIANFAKEKILK